jgi:type VI secretion system ImpM family protein
MKQELLSTGCFGKRPPAADYIHHHRGGAVILDWQRWVQDGVGLASARFRAGVEPLLRHLRITQFAFPGARSDVYLIGALGPGEDRSGRLFPFTVFAEVQPEPTFSVADLVCRREGVWRRAAEIAADTEIDLPALFEKVDGMGSDDRTAPAADQTVAEYLARVTVGALVAGRDGESAPDPAGIVRNLRRVAERADRDRSLPAYGLRFPLPSEPDRASAARAVFLEMSLRALGPKLRPAIFWTEAGPDGHLDLYPGRVGPEAFLPIVSPSYHGDAIFAMDDDAGGPSVRESQEGPAEACWAEPGLSLLEAVDRCATSSGWRRV